VACSGWDSRTWCVLGSRNEEPSRDWAWWRLDGWGTGRPKRKEGEWGEGPSLAITAIFGLRFAYVFRLSVSMRKVACKHLFCVHIHIYEFLHISHLFHFIYFLEKHISNIWFYMLDIIISRHTWNSQIRKHIHTEIQTHTHPHTHKKNKKKEWGGKTGGGFQRRKEKKRKRTKRKKRGGKKKDEKREGGKKEGKRKREGDGFRRVEESGRWVE